MVGFLSTLEPLQVTTKFNLALHYQSSHEEGNTNFSELNHKLGSLRATPSHLGDGFPRVTNII
jgi:hypothetical protein